jgi:hypothetical protein
MARSESQWTRSLDGTSTDSMSPELHLQTKLGVGYIRYVRILPGFTYDIHCETRVFQSGKLVSYKALSYAWGDNFAAYTNNTSPCLVSSQMWCALTGEYILVDGRRRRVGRNLHHFLHHASRLPQQFSGWLWIDALCIDQSDAEERTRQIGIMSQIFSRASQVVVWLGNADVFTDIAMEALSTGKHASWDRTIPLTNTIWQLCERPYWKRLWVFQELKLASDILLMCGGRLLPWEPFQSYWRGVLDHFEAVSGDSADKMELTLATSMVMLRTKPTASSLWDLLRATKNLECSDKRDRAYALLSVATEGHEHIQADYGASISTLAHRILSSKHAITPPASLEAVMDECQFLQEVLRMQPGEMYLYEGSCHRPSEVLSRSENVRFWHEWVSFHDHFEVARLLGFVGSISGTSRVRGPSLMKIQDLGRLLVQWFGMDVSTSDVVRMA